METIKFNGKKYAIGLRWSSTSSDKVAAEVAALSEETGMHYGVVRKTTTDGVSHVQVGLSDEKAHVGLISAAAILADLEENIIFIEDIDDNSHWVCAIADGQVIAGSDVIVDREEIDRVVNDIINELASSTANIKLCYSDKIENITGIAPQIKADLSEIFEQARIKNFNKVFKKYSVKNLKGIPRSVILFLIFTGLCGALSYYAINAQNEYESELERQESINETMIIVKKEPTKEELLQKAYEEEKVWFSEMLSSRNSTSLLSDVESFARGLAKNQFGWTAVSISYDSGAPGSVSVRWKKTFGGTSLTLKDGLKADSISFGINGIDATSSHNVVDIKTRNIKDPVVFLKGVNYNYQEMMHDMELLGFRYAFGIAQPTERQKPIAGIQDQTLAMSRQFNVKTKTFALSNDGLPKMNLLQAVMSKAESAVVNKIDIDLEKGFVWNISGEIYED